MIMQKDYESDDILGGAMDNRGLICHEDFSSAKIQIKLVNMATQTVVDSRLKTVGAIPMGDAADENLVQLVQIVPKGMILSVPRYAGAVGHQLMLEFQVQKLAGQDFDFTLLGKIKVLEKASEVQDRIEVALKDIEDRDWRKFCQAFSDRQDKVNEFFKEVRGY